MSDMQQSVWPVLNPRYTRAFGTLEVRRTEEANGRLWIEGKASTETSDRHKTRIRSNSLRDALGTYSTRGFHFMHDPGAQIGRVEEVAFTKDNEALIRAWIGKDFEFPYQPNPFAPVTMLSVNNVRSQMEQGLMTGLSIGFFADEDGEDESDRDITWLKVTDWVETSLCAIPSNRETLATIARSMLGRSSALVEHDPAVRAALAAMNGTNVETDEDKALIQLVKEIRAWQGQANRH